MSGGEGDKPVFTERTDSRGRLIICTIGEHQGAARVFSSGEQNARDRAELQARAKQKREEGNGAA